MIMVSIILFKEEFLIRCCRVCGFNYDAIGIEPEYFPWGPDGEIPAYHFCHCCHCEFGYRDFSPYAIRVHREKWISEGMVFHDLPYKPVGWNAEEQLENIPEEFRRLWFDHKSPLSDEVLLEHMSRVTTFPLPSWCEFVTQDTDVRTGRDSILNAAELLLVKKQNPGEIFLNDMTTFILSFELELSKFTKIYGRVPPGSKKCEQYHYCVRFLGIIYVELIARGVKPVPF